MRHRPPTSDMPRRGLTPSGGGHSDVGGRPFYVIYLRVRQCRGGAVYILNIRDAMLSTLS